jgi:hypothetical protein
MHQVLVKLRSWFQQPSTLVAAGLLVGAGVYWWTKSPEMALMAAALIPGAVNDHSTQILTKIEGVEDSLRPQTYGGSVPGIVSKAGAVR